MNTQTKHISVRDLAEDIRRRHGLPQSSNVALLPDRHPQYRLCERHGRYPASRIDADGTVRYIMPADCPRCRHERHLATLLDRAAIPLRYQHCDLDNYQILYPAQRAVVDVCQRFATEFTKNQDGRGLILLGPPRHRQKPSGGGHCAETTGAGADRPSDHRLGADRPDPRDLAAGGRPE